MKNQLLKSLLIISLIMPATGMAENNSISLGDLFKKITKSPVTEQSAEATPGIDENLGVNGFRSKDDVKRFLQDIGWFKGQVIDVIESPAFEGFYTLLGNSSDNEWLPRGMLFSKTDNFVFGSEGAFSNNQHKQTLFEVANQKLNPSKQDYKTFVKTRLLPKLKNNLFIKITNKSIEPTAYVISAADCPHCRKLEKSLYKAKVSHYVLPDFSMSDTDDLLALKNDVGIVCGGEKPWVDKMVNNIQFKSLALCEDKYEYYLAKKEIYDVLDSVKLRGFPTTIFVRGSESMVIRGYCDALPKLINNNNTGKSVNSDDCK